MENHFIEENDTNGWYYKVIFLLLALLTFGLGFILLYDVIIERKYYINRKRLIKYLNDDNNKLTMINSFVGMQFMDDITDYTLTIDDATYKIWLWTKIDGKSKVTLGKLDSPSSDYIGLFLTSPITKKLNNKIVDILQSKTPELFK